MDGDTTNELNTTFAVSGTNLELTDAGGTLSVPLTNIADNLGNHTAIQNIQLDGHYLSGDGGSEGVFVDAAGDVGIGTNTNPTSALHVSGAIALPQASVSAAMTLTNTQHVVKVNTTAGNVSIGLPAASSAPGRIYTIIKTDTSNNSLVFTTTIQTNGTTFTSANVPGAYTLQSDGTNWVHIN